MVFTYDQDVLNEVKQENYVGALALLKQKWENDPDNAERLITYGCALWYVINYHNPWYPLIPDDPEGKQLNAYMDELFRLHSIVLTKPDIPAELRGCWGWLVSIMPYYFQGGSLKDGEQLGNDMIIQAYHDQPTSKFLEVIYASTIGDEAWYRRGCEEMTPIWHQYFEDDWFLGGYFIAISSNESFGCE